MNTLVGATYRATSIINFSITDGASPNVFYSCIIVPGNGCTFSETVNQDFYPVLRLDHIEPPYDLLF